MKNNATRHYSQTERAKSTAATGQRIVEAFVQRLHDQWYDEITLADVADDAGVTVQTVIRRFGGKAGLLAEAIQSMGRGAAERRAVPSGDLEQLVRNLVKDYEQIGDTVIRLLALEQRSTVLHEHLQLGRSWHRNWVTEAFADDLRPLKGQERQAAIDALVVATDLYVWKLLRRDMQRSIAATERIMRNLIRSVMTPHLLV